MESTGRGGSFTPNFAKPGGEGTAKTDGFLPKSGWSMFIYVCIIRYLYIYNYIYIKSQYIYIFDSIYVYICMYKRF